jgi:DnaJ-class molecular chaperone
MQVTQDYYRVLGVAPEANMAAIKAAYYKLASMYHPDKNPNNPETYLKMLEINEAYAALADRVRRGEYDHSMGYTAAEPKFRVGSKVRINSRSSPFMDHTGLVDKEPVKDSFRFWYMVEFQSNGLSSVGRFAEEQLVEVG